ncbi:unnamed protein product [Allacma fusca]|uniref:Uncharacterized protein n=1 Tax=Allacma fusca TaxID=39272 RepID=A0A8J2J0U6_9HEXA|nr:unnamed protein product [Allacma fusca]
MDEEVTENDTKSAQLTSKFIRGMLQRPMVRLFTGENFTGDSVDYHFGKTNHDKGCYRINRYQSLRFRTFKSAATFDKCIRLFHDEYCSGLSLAIYGEE